MGSNLLYEYYVVPDNIHSVATFWSVRGSKSGVVEILLTRPERPSGPSSLLY